MTTSKTIYLLLGTNLGNREDNLKNAISLIEERLETKAMQSGIYETAAWGKTNQPGFLNQAIRIESSKKPTDLLKTINVIEADLGRERFEKWGPRLIDIDILFIGNEIVQKKELIIPHAEVQNRKFALIPLLDLAPNLVHPVFKISVSELLNQCADNLKVIKV